MASTKRAENESLDYVFSTSLSLRDGYMFCEDVRISDLQKSIQRQLEETDIHTSPFFVFSKKQIIQNIRAYKKPLEGAKMPFTLGYSLKAHFNPTILKLFRDEGCTAVTVSGNEIRLAIQVGMDPTKIIFNGNGKMQWETELAVRQGCLINIDSAFDLQHLQEITKRLSIKAKIILRLNPNIDTLVHPFLATGLGASKFGIDEPQLHKMLDVIKKDHNLTLVGLHCHLGSTIDNIRVFKECIDVMLAWIDNVRNKGFADIKYLNMGGGLGIDYRKHEERTMVGKPKAHPTEADHVNFLQDVQDRFKSSPDVREEVIRLMNEYHINGFFSEPLEMVVKHVVKLFADHPDLLRGFNTVVPNANVNVPMPTAEDLVQPVINKLAQTNLHLILEPGRSLIGNAGTFICQVIGVKQNKDTRYIVIDGSMSEVLRPCLYSAYHHIELTEPTQMVPHHNRELSDIVGPVCECSDFIGKERLLPIPHEKCGIAIFDAGAYCGSMASNYNMRCRPAEILVDKDQWNIIRNPETYNDMMKAFPEYS